MDSRRIYQNQSLAEIPQTPGLYAWYYRPRRVDILNFTTRFDALLQQRYVISTEVEFRYKRKVVVKNTGIDQPDPQQTSFGDAAPVLADLFAGESFLGFCRPLYIGVAAKQTLYTRVYQQHFMDFSSYWQDNSNVNTFLIRNPNATLDELLSETGKDVSFALQARYFGISPQDLAVSVLPVDAESADKLFAIEKLLHLLADPVCGRR